MITIKAPAKINLGLRITGKLPNGFHSIHSIFVPIQGLCDTITLQESESMECITDSELGIAKEQNLVYKAALSIKEYAYIKSNVSITLKKNIPTGAGLGGGSSDAASTLIALRTFWNLDISDSALETLALSLGSDVPFFLKHQIALVEGQGETITRLPYQLSGYLLLIFPTIHINTAWAYSLIQNQFSQDFEHFEKLLPQYLQGSLPGNVFENDFEQFIFKEYPELATIKNSLFTHGADIALMSGSGSTMYGIFNNKKDAMQAANSLKNYKQLLTEL